MKKQNKTIIFIPIYIILIGIIILVLNMTISDIKTNKNKLYEDYLDTHMLLTLYDTVLPDCKNINVILKKDLIDKKLKRYERIELSYYFNKYPDCEREINTFLHGGFQKYKFGKHFNQKKYKEVKRIKKLRMELKKNIGIENYMIKGKDTNGTKGKNKK